MQIHCGEDKTVSISTILQAINDNHTIGNANEAEITLLKKLSEKMLTYRGEFGGVGVPTTFCNTDLVSHNGVMYLSLNNSNTDSPTTNNWFPFKKYANPTGDSTVRFQVENGINDNDAVNFRQLKAVIARLDAGGL